MWKHVTSLLREISSFNRFFQKNHAPHRRITFFSEKDIYYQTFEPFLTELLRDPNFTCSYLTRDPKDPILTNHPERVYPFYFNAFIKSIFDHIDATCLVMTMPDLNTLYVRKNNKTREYVYLFHSFSSTHLQYNERAFDAYDTIFCVGPHHIQEIQKREQQFSLPKKRLLSIGYPRIERIESNYQRYTKKYPGQTTVLIAPTWSIASLFVNGIDALLEALQTTPYRVIVRPHPEFLKRCAGSAQSLKAHVQAIPNFFWEDTLLSEENLYEADLLVTDRSGIAFEYAFGTQRPVLFIDTPYKEHNQNWRALNLEPIELQLRNQLGVAVPLDQLPQIVPIVENLLQHASEWKHTLHHLYIQQVFHPHHAAQEGANYLLHRFQA
ncbi:MAG: CDP-glycerol glycerophosphotransferase family protein [Opitutales bacterium]|nr:CDP-glycerol glycerophosphotransferase family protein [Opitutales bacterium]